jgi:RNA polymerase sigma factor (sigma-70 family)
LAAVYWRPVYAYVRLAHRAAPEDAEDLTQGFFAEALRRDLFARYEPDRARFRTYLRTCVDSYVVNELRAATRLKRGGVSRSTVDIAEIEGRLTSESDPDAGFHREWVRALFGAAFDRLRARCASTGREKHLALFERYDVADAGGLTAPTYAELAMDLGLTSTQVTNWLAAIRREFRAIVLETLRDLCVDEDEFRAEARALLGVEVS